MSPNIHGVKLFANLDATDPDCGILLGEDFGKLHHPAQVLLAEAGGPYS
jgi:hypothetical protein